MKTRAKESALDAYLKLVREFPLRKLRTVREHAQAIRLLVRLSHATDSASNDYADVLARLVADYEERSQFAFDASFVTVGDLIRHRLAERGVSVARFAGEIRIAQSNLSEMLAGSRSWSKAAISAISKSLNIRAERFFAEAK